MSITEAEAKQLIIDTVGDCDDQGAPFPDPPSSGIISRTIDVAWASHDGIRASVQYEYTKLDAIDMVLARVIHMVDTTVDTVRVYKSQRARALLRLRELQVARIKAVAAGAALGDGSSTIAEIAAFQPIYPDTDREFLDSINKEPTGP